MKKTVIALLAVIFIFAFTGCKDSDSGGKKKQDPITPQQGRASGIINGPFGDKVKYEYTITFWNVGETGGGDYGKATLTIKPVQKWDRVKVYDEGTFQGVFSGGPDGEITLGKDAPISFPHIQLVNGAYFRMEAQKVPVENPGIFSGWNKNK